MGIFFLVSLGLIWGTTLCIATNQGGARAVLLHLGGGIAVALLCGGLLLPLLGYQSMLTHWNYTSDAVWIAILASCLVSTGLSFAYRRFAIKRGAA